MSRLSSYQDGRGIPYEEPKREVPTGGDVSSPYTNLPFKFDSLGNVIDVPITDKNNGSIPTEFSRKVIRVISVDLNTTFDNMLINQPGSLVYISGQSGGNMGPIKIRLDNIENDYMTMIYDRAISGIPFKQFWLKNETVQTGITCEITIISDKPIDRVGLSG